MTKHRDPAGDVRRLRTFAVLILTAAVIACRGGADDAGLVLREPAATGPTATAAVPTTPTTSPTPRAASPSATAAPTQTPAATPTAPTAPAAPSLPSALQQPIVSELAGGIPAYDRDDWQHWIDADGDCQNTRAEVLIDESAEPVTFTSASNGCTVATGLWFGPFAGQFFTRASDVDVDHMVPLKNAHDSGGWAWSASRKRDYANDLGNSQHLIAVDDGANSSKGARGPEAWKPPLTSYWCAYAVDWVGIKNAWSLTVTDAEWNALAVMLATCPGGSPTIIVAVVVTASTTPSPIPSPPPSPTVPPPSPTQTPTASPTPTPSPTRGYPIGSRTGVPVLYDPFGPDRNCGDFSTWAQAQDFYEAAGGNNAHGLDSNKDGVACQSLSGAP